MTTEEEREAGENKQWRREGFSPLDDWMGSGEAKLPRVRETKRNLSRPPFRARREK